MLRAIIKCSSCGWEGYPDERADWCSTYDKDYVSKESICPQCSKLYFDAPAYLEELRRLAHKHHFGFVFNPGGGEFTSDEFGNCQIGTNDAFSDYMKFLTFLVSKGLE